MQLNVKNDISFGANILDIEVPKALRKKVKSDWTTLTAHWVAKVSLLLR